jgi:hypothetical protein
MFKLTAYLYNWSKWHHYVWRLTAALLHDKNEQKAGKIYLGSRMQKTEYLKYLLLHEL